MDMIEQKAVSVTGLIFTLPSYRKTTAYLLAVSFAAGFLLTALLSINGSFSLTDALVYGGAEGVLVLALPALVAAALATTMASRKEFRKGFRHFIFIAFASAVLAAAVYIAGVLVTKFWNVELYVPVLLANSLVFILWFTSSYVALNYGRKAVVLSLLQPVANLSFTVLWRASDAMGAPSPIVAAGSFIVSTAILLVALWSLFYMINAPARRNFGISGVQAAALFFAQWIKGSKGLEEVLSEMGEKATTLLGVVVFRKRRTQAAAVARGELGGGYKAFFVVPHVHFGPFGNLGGSEFPAAISRWVAGKFGAPAFVFHSLTDHDFNPVYSSSVHGVEKALGEMVARQKKFSGEASFVFSERDSGRVFGFSFGGKGFLAVSRAPHSTEDIEFPLGVALRNRALKKFSEAVLVDCHNSKTSGHKIESGGGDYFAFEEAIDSLDPGEDGGQLRMGTAVDDLKGFSTTEGIAGAGLRVAVFGVGARKYCLVLIDANNALPAFRAEVLSRLRKFGFDYCDIMTTDSHAVNAVNGTHNPLGMRTSRKALAERIDAAVAQALNDLEPVEAGMAVEKIELEILGSKRSSELISTVNSIVAVTKITAPAVFVLSVVAAFVSLLLLR
ncbi:MAG: DUF2070 family protein [Candidatus Micrarchaeota archaeon]|nr:DUF2070 family protein [Candidatus Micrarchaeota archaeon]